MKNSNYKQLTKVQALILLKIVACYSDIPFTRKLLSTKLSDRTEASLKAPLLELKDYGLITINPDLKQISLLNPQVILKQIEYSLTDKGREAFVLLSKINICGNTFSVQDRVIDILLILKKHKEDKIIIKELLSKFCSDRELVNTMENYYYGLIKNLRENFLVCTSVAHKRKNGLIISISDLGEVFLHSCLKLDRLLK